ncbi:hypothetical protein E6P78_06715 [Streptomyces sp. A0958]|uniref:integrase core domain-containing protein n=1 Tax=Streptomyces sp. A0958 TaxID=2563101 RepID=UPI00109EBA2A|nr:integrase core domain-containing protein [Streptomyces sp. A0958]THA71598.1 hypothetical protein E6P78_06715 [Streptomyces sp. A0958]
MSEESAVPVERPVVVRVPVEPVGSALDNAAAESFHSVLKVEYVHRHDLATRAEARLKTVTWITDFYKTRRRHSAAGGRPPVEFERTIQQARTRTDQDARAA